MSSQLLMSSQLSETPVSTSDEPTPVEVGVIDCDVHPIVPGEWAALWPYLTTTWRQRLDFLKHEDMMAGAGTALGRAPIWEGTNMRPDAIPPSGGAPGSDVEFFKQQYLDPHGIETALLLSLQASVVETFTLTDDSAAIVSAFNDLLLEQWCGYDRRFRLAMVVSPHDPDLAAKEVRRLRDHPAVVAIWLPLISKLLGERYFYPIYEAAQECELPIILHGTGFESDVVGSAAFAGGIPATRAERNSTFAEFAMGNLASLVFQGVFERYKGLKVVFAEYGWVWIASFMWRMDEIWRAARYTVPWTRKAPSEYVADHVRFTSQPALDIPKREWLDQILEMMNARQILLFSSDYPHWDADNPEFPFRTLDEKLQERILRENAVDFFGPRMITAR